MKTSNWAAVTLLAVILTAAAMVWMGWFGSSRGARAGAVNHGTPQSSAPGKNPDVMNSQAAWQYRRSQTPNWKLAMVYHP
jgi:hypothetical protein